MEKIISWHELGQRQPLRGLSRTKEILAWLGHVPIGMSQVEYWELMDNFHAFLEKVRRDARLKDALSNQSAAQTHVG